MLLQAIAFSYAEAQADQHVLAGDATDEINGDQFRAEVSAPSGGQSIREPGTD